jgi:O-antigen/teichoic acid export membrane protein
MSWFRSGTITLGSQVVVSGSNFLATVVPAKALGQLGFGHYILAQASILLLSSLVAAAVLIPVRIRGVGVEGQDRRSFFDGQCALVALLVIVLGIVGLSLQVGLVGLPHEVALSGMICFGLAQFTEFRRAELATRANWAQILKLDIYVHGVRTALIIALALSNFLDATTALTAYAVALSIGLFAYRPGFSAIRGARQSFSRLLSKSWQANRWYLYESLVFIASTQTFVFVLGRMLSPVESGALGAFQQLTNVVNVFHMGVVTYVTTYARATLVRGDYRGWVQVNVRCLAVLVSFTALVMGALISFGPSLLTALYTDEIAEQSALLYPLGVMSVLWAANMVWTMAFRVAELPQVGMAAKAGGAIVALLVAIPLIRAFGIQGAVYGMVATQLTWFLVFCYIGFARNALSQSALPWESIKAPHTSKAPE